MLCENNGRLAKTTIVGPGCYDNQAVWKVTITYSEVEYDELYLCDVCKNTIAADARRHGYKVRYIKRR